MTLTNRRTIWMMLPVVAALLAGCTTPTTEVPRTAALDTPDRVVTYPEGRYQLYGDGRITPYYWVWVPNGSTAIPPPSAPR